MAESKRNIIFDAVKAFAIASVVYGHSIQYLGGSTWDSEIFRFIYTFHMPLFFMVSGFFSSSIQLGGKAFLIKKIATLLLPCFIWTIIFSAINFCDWNHFFVHVLNPLNWNLWFFKGLFLVQFVVYVCMRVGSKLSHNKEYATIIAIFLSMSVYVLPFMYVPRVMLPMFWIGYIIRLHYDWFAKYYRWIAVIAVLVFGVLYPFGKDYVQEMYNGTMVKFYELILGKEDWINVYKLICRLLLGACGSIAVMAVMHALKNIPNAILTIGSSTQGIYIFQALLLESLMGSYMNLSGWNGCLLYFVVLPIISILIISICTFLTKFVGKNKILGLLLLGRWPGMEGGVMNKLNQNKDAK